MSKKGDMKQSGPVGGPAAPHRVLPRSLLFGNPDRASLSVSPDGTKIGYLAPLNGMLNVWIAPKDKPGKAEAVTNDTVRGIRVYFWAFNNRHIIYLQDSGGDENWQVHVVDLETKEDRNCTPFEEIAGADGKPRTHPDGKKMKPTARIQDVSYKFPNEILIGLNNRNPEFHDVYRLNLLSGDMELVERNDTFAGYLSDRDFLLRYAWRVIQDGSTEFFVKHKGEDWRLADTVSMEDSMTTRPVTFDASGKILYMIDSRERDTAALVSVQTVGGEKELHFVNERADVSDLMVHPTERTVQAAACNFFRNEWTVLDETIRSDLDFLSEQAEGDIRVVSRSLDDTVWATASIEDDGPVRYYLYERSKKEARYLFSNRRDLEDSKLSKMRPVIIKSRDNKELVSYLTLPSWTHRAKGPVSSSLDLPCPDSPLPTVLLVHGGPWGRDSWGYNPLHQWLSNRGYAVLSVNFRGSTGFGKTFLNAGNREWGGTMHDDLVDAVQWAVTAGIADKERVAIMGASYGGYAALVGLTFTPDLFACGVDIVGPSNLITLLETVPPYWKPILNNLIARVGDHRTEEGKAFLTSRSPLPYADRIQKPLLIGQGANDPRVKQAESDRIVQAMKDKNIPVTYLLYPDEGHGFARPENRLSFFAAADLFLSRILGGRCEPIGEDCNRSSITIQEGADFIPELEEHVP